MNVLNSAREYAYFITPYLLISDEMKRLLLWQPEERGCADYHRAYQLKFVYQATFILQQIGKKGCADF
ncbi:MAG: hypothetical protein ACLR5Q_11450 [Coprococcus sp.]